MLPLINADSMAGITVDLTKRIETCARKVPAPSLLASVVWTSLIWMSAESATQPSQCRRLPAVLFRLGPVEHLAFYVRTSRHEIRAGRSLVSLVPRTRAAIHDAVVHSQSRLAHHCASARLVENPPVIEQT
jgi:hypothetical protein